MTKPEITVLMAVYNGAKFLRESIESILGQSFTNFELLIIDDGSNDNSVEIINSFTDGRIRLIRNNTNRGLVFTRNRGIEEAKGRLLAILDCDDISISNRLELQYNFLAKNPKIKLCGGQAISIDENGQESGKNLKVSTENKTLSLNLIFHNVFINSTIMMHLETAKEAGGYNAAYPYCEDYALSIVIAERHSVGNLAEYLIKYRIHSDSTSQLKMDLMKEHEAKIVMSIHKGLEIDYNPELLKTHLSFISPTDNLPTLQDYKRLFIAIKKGNSKVRKYDQALLSDYIFLMWYNIIRAKKQQNALWDYLNIDLFNPRSATFKQVRKIVKQCIFGS
jgi:glycosyltransferase involved in cell wall biosynthesis